MKNAAVMEAPAETGPGSATPELIAHEWAGNGDCVNPESVVVDFGKKAGKRQGSFVLGLRPDGSWRLGWHLVTKDNQLHTQPCREDEVSFASRPVALRFGLAHAQKIFEGDRPAVQTLAAFFAKTLNATTEAGESLPANTPVATSHPLPEATPMEIPVGAIQRNPEQPRKDFPAIQEQELADSIASVGLLQRIVVRKLLPEEVAELPGMNDRDHYELIAGERRWRAHKRLERETIKAEVYTGLTRAQAAAAALVENLQREGLNCIEEAEGFRDLMAKEGLTQEQCAQRVGVSRPVVANALRVLELPDKALAYGREGKLTLAHLTALARFKKYPALVAFIAETAARDNLTAAQLEKGLPCAHELVQAELVARIQPHQFKYEVPAELKKHPSYFNGGDYNEFLLEPAAYNEFKAKFEAEAQAEADAEAERERKKAERAAKNPQKIKNLADLPPNSFVQIYGEVKPLMALVPDQAQLELKDDEGQHALVCTKPNLFRKIEKAVAELRIADRKEKWTRVILDALAAVSRTKKIGPRESMLLVFIASKTGDSVSELYPGPRLFVEKGSGLGVKIPKKALSEHYEADVEFSVEALTLLMKEPGPVDCYRVLVDSWLRQLENDLVDQGYDFGADSDLGTLCKWVLERDELGFLEETKAGQKQILDTVQAQEWYQRDVAEIEGREYVPPTPESLKKVAADEAKAGKKGGTPAASERIAEVKELLKAGKTNAEIMAAVGISLPTLANYKKALGVKRP